MKEKKFNIYWDWKAVQGKINPLAVTKRLEAIGFEFDDTCEAFVIPRMMSSHGFRKECYDIGVKTIAIEGTSEQESV